ncbi:MAG TPA: hypothetical protein VEG34_08835, partial [Thermoanaerobaculia bacterium]|nr:hypothetical protein [Thermoanaerobaculia bacterium]
MILLGLLGGFAIALPALVITTLAFITAFPHFFQAIRTKGVTVELVPPERGIVNNRPKPNAYILAVDLSGSTVQGREDPQLELVEMAVDDLFSKESGGVLADLVQHQDDFGLYVFAGSRRLVIHPGMENNLRSTDMPAEFRRAVKDNMGKLEADETDIIT